MTPTDAIATITYLANEWRKACETAGQQHQILLAQRDQLKKADEEIARLKALLPKEDPPAGG